jgi:ribosome recycling factor
MQLRTLLILSFLAVSSVSAFVQHTNHRGAFFAVGGRNSVVPLFAEAVDEVSMDTEERMIKTIENVLQSMQTVRTGRASPAILDRVKCDYYGAETPISQMATISVPSAQQLSIDPYDKSVLQDIERAIFDADLGLTPQSDGSMIRLNIPALTEDRRKEMLKQCKALGEEGKVAIRNIRRNSVDAIKKLEKSGDIGEDEMKDGLDEVQKMTDGKVKEIDTIVEKKEKEVMTV